MKTQKTNRKPDYIPKEKVDHKRNIKVYTIKRRNK